VDDPEGTRHLFFLSAMLGQNRRRQRGFQSANFISLLPTSRKMPIVGLYKEFAPDFFDLIIVDECHRAARKKIELARNPRVFPAGRINMGMTATPLRG